MARPVCALNAAGKSILLKPAQASACAIGLAISAAAGLAVLAGLAFVAIAALCAASICNKHLPKHTSSPTADATASRGRPCHVQPQHQAVGLERTASSSGSSTTSHTRPAVPVDRSTTAAEEAGCPEGGGARGGRRTIKARRQAEVTAAPCWPTSGLAARIRFDILFALREADGGL